MRYGLHKRMRLLVLSHMHSAAKLSTARAFVAKGRIRAAARMLLDERSPAAAVMLDGLPTHGPHGAVLAERLRFGPPETWRGWRRGEGRVAVKLWPETAPALAPLAAFAHPGLAPLLAAGPHWRVFAWIDGETLATHLRRAMPLDGLAVMTALEDAVAALHGAGLAHGDLTPANVVIAADGHPVLIDWGEDSAGTPGWCPEEPHDARARDRHGLARLAALLVSGPPPTTNTP